MITVLELMDRLGWNVVSSAPYLWASYGSNARFMDFSHDEGLWHVSCVFDRITTRIFEISGSSTSVPAGPWTWIDPEFASERTAEATVRGIDLTMAWDGVKYHVINAEDDLLSILTRTVGA